MADTRDLKSRVRNGRTGSSPVRGTKNNMITKLQLDSNNRMLRFGFGKHEGKWFVRLDLWKVGYRFSCLA